MTKLNNNVLISIDRDHLKFLQGLSREMKSQDNRATHNPYFVVKTTKRVIGMIPENSDDTIWIDMYSGDYTEYATKEEGIKDLKDSGHGVIDAEDFLEEFGVMEVEESMNFFLTERGYNQHMELNGHNYRYSTKKAYSYVDCAHRNPEYEGLVAAIHAIGESDEV